MWRAKKEKADDDIDDNDPTRELDGLDFDFLELGGASAGNGSGAAAVVGAGRRPTAARRRRGAGGAGGGSTTMFFGRSGGGGGRRPRPRTAAEGRGTTPSTGEEGVVVVDAEDGDGTRVVAGGDPPLFGAAASAEGLPSVAEGSGMTDVIVGASSACRGGEQPRRSIPPRRRGGGGRAPPTPEGPAPRGVGGGGGGPPLHRGAATAAAASDARARPPNPPRNRAGGAVEGGSGFGGGGVGGSKVPELIASMRHDLRAGAASASDYFPSDRDGLARLVTATTIAARRRCGNLAKWGAAAAKRRCGGRRRPRDGCGALLSAATAAAAPSTKSAPRPYRRRDFTGGFLCLIFCAAVSLASIGSSNRKSDGGDSAAVAAAASKSSIRQDLREGAAVLREDLREGKTALRRAVAEVESQAKAGAKVLREDLRKGARAFGEDLREGAAVLREDLRHVVDEVEERAEADLEFVEEDLRAGAAVLRDDLRKGAHLLGQAEKKAARKVRAGIVSQLRRNKNAGGSGSAIEEDALSNGSNAKDGPIDDSSVRPNEDGGGQKADEEETGIYIPSLYQHSFANVHDLPRKESPRESSTPVYWHVPKSGGTTVADVFTHCLGLVSASKIGATEGHGEEDSLEVNIYKDGGQYVNVDTTTVLGIQRAKHLGLVQSNLADVIITHRFHEVARLFDDDRRGRAFACFRHPVNRAVSMFYYLQQATWEPTYDRTLADMTLEEYATSYKAEDNWVVRSMTNDFEEQVTEQHLDVAREILRRKFLVGILEKYDASMERFERYFGWWENRLVRDPNHVACQNRISRERDNIGKHPQAPGAGSAGYEALKRRNWADVELYEYALVLFEEQASLVDDV